MKQDGKAALFLDVALVLWVPLPRDGEESGKFTLHRQLYDAAVFTKRVDGVTREETRVLTNRRHNLHTDTVYHEN